MTDKEKLMIIGVIDELLIEQLDHTEHFTEDERQEVHAKYDGIFDTTSPRDIRESLIDLARKLYEETKDG